MWGVVPGRRGYRRRSETGVEPGAPAAQRDGCRDSSDAGEPAVLTTMSAAMHRYVEVVKQYPGPEQVDMRVEIQVPGSWFGAGPMGALTDAERREKYTAQAVEYAEVREFPGACRGSRKTKEQAIRFICAADAADEPNSEGYWMKLSQWNRFRNDTFKDRREDELAFIPGQAPAAEGGVAMNLKAPQAPSSDLACLQSTLFSANEVSGLVQKQDGMGLSMGYQMAKVLKDEATAMKLMVVSGTTKEGDWKETHVNVLPNMFKVQRRIFAEQLELRFKVDGTPDKHTLLALKLDPSVNTTQEDGIFSKRAAAQLLMEGEYRRRLVRRHKLMLAAVAVAGSSVAGSAASSALVPGKRPASSTRATGGVAKRGPASVLSRVNNTNSGQNVKTVRTDPDHDDSLDIIKLEEAKYAGICVSVLANKQQYMVSGIFDLSVFWSGQKSVIPVHYSLWVAEVGCAKVSSANVETVFSGAGRISMKSNCLGPEILSNYAFLHYNYKYDWLRPTLEEIVDTYTKLYGKESRESDIESDGSSEAEEVEEDGEED